MDHSFLYAIDVHCDPRSIVMDLSEAYRKQLPLVIEHPVGGPRIIAALVIDERRLAFAQDGWSLGATSHPLHILEGCNSGDGPWYVGSAKIRVLDEHESLMFFWKDWNRTTEPAARGRAEELLRDLLGSSEAEMT
ncbi:hypothetical protein DS843_22445 [Roseomonas genomospecies 6]|uniref:Uncharacterized protein n=1 Tax=Roseomonas genomospecies 6 TaxID=214106 RepID=A0A9W7NG27_9PROT|nr:hypothetical protein DS843_22445 [Roseomonas genomospecies 6]